MRTIQPIVRADSEAGKPWAVEPSDQRFSEVVRLSVRAKTYGWAHIDIGGHQAAVVVFGADQAEAEQRAKRIVEAVTRAAADDFLRLTEQDRREVEAIRKGGFCRCLYEPCRCVGPRAIEYVQRHG